MSAIDARPARITDLGLTFAPFAILIGAAIIGGAFASDALYARTLWPFRIAMLLAAPALALFVFSFGRQPLGALWRLWWTFAFLATLIHTGFAFLGMHGGDIGTVAQTMGETGAVLVTVVLLVWALDVALAWAAPRRDGILIMLVRLVAAVGVIASTLYATFNRTGAIYWLGIALIAILALFLIARLLTPSGPART
jgi:hypothetical protein